MCVESGARCKGIASPRVTPVPLGVELYSFYPRACPCLSLARVTDQGVLAAQQDAHLYRLTKASEISKSLDPIAIARNRRRMSMVRLQVRTCDTMC